MSENESFRHHLHLSVDSTRDGGRPRPEINPITVSGGPHTVAINHGSTFLVCGSDGDIDTREGQPQGLYAEDTRFLSGHELRLNGECLECIASARLSFRHGRWTLLAPRLRQIDGRATQVRVTVTLDRLISARRLQEEIAVHAYGREPITMLLALALESDFADIFEVRTARWQRRSSIGTHWSPATGLDTLYERDGFARRCLVRSLPRSQSVSYSGGALRFPIDLEPGAEWRVLLQYDLLTTPRGRPSLGAVNHRAPAVEDRAEQLRRRWHQTAARVHASDPRLEAAFDQAVDDFAALRLYDQGFTRDVWVPAAGVPWFVAVFGRDSIIASMQALPVHPLFAIGTLQKLAQMQSTVDDPVRDAEPGKICHEMRVGEWARFGVIPHSPYYGTADATPLYLQLLGETHRWLGRPQLLRQFRETALRCLEWIDRYGDVDGDGLQEYRPRTPGGYRNHCWRDAEDGVLDECGGFPPHPIGTCEMQGYVYDAKRTVAGLFAAWGDGELAERLVGESEELRRRFLDAYWLEEEGTLAFALDGEKRRVRTATSNPGHCLLSGVLDPGQARRVADRLMRPDLFSGWGLRTLSSDHPVYDPHSYQCGSVWPHDTMFAAAGLRRYGMAAEGWMLMDGLLGAVVSFERAQMPELFAGLQRTPPDVPVPYERANVPQAWAAGSIFQLVRVMLGLEPDLPAGRLYVNPVLPPWCPELRMENIRVGDLRVSVEARQRGDGHCAVTVETLGRAALQVVGGPPPWAPLASVAVPGGAPAGT
jgi:glycogen debranching enzyme